MPRPCRATKAFRLCLFHLIYIVRPCLIHTCYAMPMSALAMPRPCRSESELSRPRHSTTWHSMAWHGMCELASAVQRRHVGDLPPRSASSGYHTEFHEGYQKQTNPLNCRTSSSDISGYHADSEEGHGTVGEWQGHGMECVN
jgi:hypothetical protein